MTIRQPARSSHARSKAQSNVLVWSNPVARWWSLLTLVSVSLSGMVNALRSEALSTRRPCHSATCSAPV